MKKNKILLSAISGSVVLATIPALTTSCSKKGPSVVEDIDFSEVTLEQHKYLNSDYVHKALLVYQGFKLKTGSFENLSVEATNIKDFDYGVISPYIIEGENNEFSVAIEFESYNYLNGQNPKFDLLFKEETTSWKQKTISGFSSYFTVTQLYIDVTFSSAQYVHTLNSKTTFTIDTPVTAVYDDEVLPAYDSFEVSFIPATTSNCSVKPYLTVNKSAEHPYLMYINFDIDNISGDETVYGYLAFKNKLIPNWYQTKIVRLKISTSIEESFACEYNSATKTCKLTSLKCCDQDVVIPSTMNYEGEEYKVTSINLSQKNFIASSVKSLTIPETIESISLKDNFKYAYNLEKIKVNDGCTNYSSKDSKGNECNCLIDTVNKKVLVGASQSTIPDNVTSIANGAFWGRTNLSSIIIPNNVESLGENVFYDCVNLKTITFSNALTSIGSSCFCQCLSLDTISIPEGVEELPQFCFSTCLSLKTVVLPSTLREIGQVCFFGCLSLENIELPDSLTTLSNSVFAMCKSLKSINIPGQIESLPASLFNGCSSLSQVTLSEGLTTIESEAFKDCTSLENITLPDSLERIKASAFSYTNLKKLHIGPNVTSISFPIADHCNNLTELTVDTSNQYYKSLNDNTIVSQDGTLLFATTKNADLSQVLSLVTTIGSSAFQGCDWLTSITIPSNITTINELAFEDCPNLTSADLSNYTGDIPDSCFFKCIYLSSVALNNNTTTISNHAFSNCILLQNITLPSNLTTIGQYAFYNCALLKQITLPEALTTIKRYAFKSCASLESIVLPANLTNIDPDVFGDCYSLKDVTFNCNLTTIPANMFFSCYALESIQLPSTVTTLETNAFGYCSSLKTINLENITTLGSYAFNNCESLENVTLNNAITSIGQYTFNNCYSLKTINLPTSLTSIGDYAFSTCALLNSITLPDSLTTIGINAFYECYSLKSINIPAAVTKIDNNAFAYCLSLTSATFANTTNWYQGLLPVEESTMSDPAQAASILLEGYLLTRTE